MRQVTPKRRNVKSGPARPPVQAVDHHERAKDFLSEAEVEALLEAAKGVWVHLFHALATTGGLPAEVLIDSSTVKAHRCAAGGKGGSAARRSAVHAAGAQPKSTP